MVNYEKNPIEHWWFEMMCTWCFFKIRFWQNRVNLKTGIVHKKCHREINEQAKRVLRTIFVPLVKEFVEDFVKKEIKNEKNQSQ